MLYLKCNFHWNDNLHQFIWIWRKSKKINPWITQQHYFKTLQNFPNKGVAGELSAVLVATGKVMKVHPNNRIFYIHTVSLPRAVLSWRSECVQSSQAGLSARWGMRVRRGWKFSLSVINLHGTCSPALLRCVLWGQWHRISCTSYL